MKKLPSIDDILVGLKAGDRKYLSKAITLMESTLPTNIKLAETLIETIIPYAGNSIRIGITGPPGVGKSSFIEVLGNHLTGLGKKVAVIAVDPSSEITKGSILGDKTRMETLAVNPLAYIRPAPNNTHLGGIAKNTRETIFLCESAGFEVIIIETVGVGQAEIEINNLVDFNLFLFQPGSGDELQGIKMGVLEHANFIIVTKADGPNIENVIQTKNQIYNSFQFLNGKNINIETFSIFQSQNIIKIWNEIFDEIEKSKNTGHFQKNRSSQQKKWFHEIVKYKILEKFYLSNYLKINELANEIDKGEISVTTAVKNLFN